MSNRTKLRPTKGAARKDRDFSKSAIKRRMVEAEKAAHQSAAYAQALQRKLEEVYAMREMSAELGVAHEKLEQIRVACRKKMGLKGRILEILTAGTELDANTFADLPAEGESDE